jgi:hypothetical protein
MVSGTAVMMMTWHILTLLMSYQTLPLIRVQQAALLYDLVHLLHCASWLL